MVAEGTPQPLQRELADDLQQVPVTNMFFFLKHENTTVSRKCQRFRYELAEEFACVSVSVVWVLVGAFCALALLLAAAVFCRSLLSLTLLKTVKSLVRAHPERRTGASSGELTAVLLADALPPRGPGSRTPGLDHVAGPGRVS